MCDENLSSPGVSFVDLVELLGPVQSCRADWAGLADWAEMISGVGAEIISTSTLQR